MSPNAPGGIVGGAGVAPAPGGEGGTAGGEGVTHGGGGALGGAGGEHLRSAQAQNPVHTEFWVVAQFCCVHQVSVALASMLQIWVSPQPTDQPLGTVGGGGGGVGGGGYVQPASQDCLW